MTPTAARSPEVNIILSTLARLLFRLLGWRPEGSVPPRAQFVVVAAPHTSNWDGLIVILMALVLRVRLRWMGKHTLFRPPFGFILRALGGVPINRSASHNAVQQAIQSFHDHERWVLVVAPEGTRSKAARWKTGFYHIALGAGVPLVLGFIDYPRRSAGLGPVIEPSGDIEADMAIIRAFYTGITGRHPEKMSDITL
ncbi:MAG: lysophospholipid acyltransferase family protein [Chloroflexi bacterium]|nr:lysophospholipid acyltransferase family protein [Chloroflexota bacterium]